MRSANAAGARLAVLHALGAALPDRQVDNTEIAARLGTSDEWIRTRTGIRQRRIAEPPTDVTTLAVRAGRRALAAGTGRQPDAVIVATSTPPRPLPALAPQVAHALGLTDTAAFDTAAVCSGFLYALATAAGLIAAGTADEVLVIASEVYTSIVDPQDRDTAAVFADGAGAAVLRAGHPHEAGALGPFVLGSDGGLSDLIQIPAPGAYFQMRGREVFRHAVQRMSAACRSAAARAGWRLDDIDHIAAHQANARILHAIAAELALPAPRMLTNIDHLGNTGAASIPLLLHEAAQHAQLRAGDKVLLVAFGGGLTWAATTLVWPAVHLREEQP